MFQWTLHLTKAFKKKSPVPQFAEPLLPPELELLIFKFTARVYRDSATRLVLVARRVQAWIEPIIYEQIVLWTAGTSKSAEMKLFLRTLDARPAKFFAQNVKALCLRGSANDDTLRVLSVCSGVGNLALWSRPTLNMPVKILEALSSHQIKRLSAGICGFFADYSQPPSFDQPLFHNVTHLEVYDSPNLCSTWTGLSALTGLTHLAISHYGSASEDLPHSDNLVTTFVDRVSQECRSVRIILLLLDGHKELEGRMKYSEFYSPHGNLHVICWAYSSYLESWIDRVDLWELAEYTVMVKQRSAAALHYVGR